MSTRAYPQIIRPVNCLIASAAVFIAGLIAVGVQVSESARFLNLIISSFAVFFFVAAGNTLNDYYDFEVDRVNHPERPIPSGLIRREDAMTLAMTLFVPAFLLSLFVNIECFVIVVISATIIVSYEKRLKRRGFAGNVQISWLVASLFLFGGFSVYKGGVSALLRVTSIATLAFLATLGREITKDIEDLKGDKDRETLPRTMGIGRSALVARLFYAVAIIFSLLLVATDIFGILYLPSVLFADATFVATMLLVSSNPKQSSGISKIAMVVALAAFMVGVLSI